MDILMQSGPLSVIGALVIGLGLGGALVAIISQMISRAKAKTFQEDLQRQVEGAKREAENIVKSAQIDAAAETMKRREKLTAEANKIRADLHENEMRLTKREDTLDRQAESLQHREKTLKQQQQEIDRRAHNISLKEKQLTVLMAQQKNQLLKITAMDIDEAKSLLLKRLEDECEHEMSSLIQRKLEETTETADEKSREIISAAIQRYAAEHTCEVTVSTVEIPNDDMKGRIIGREGRNIRAFEKATGVDVIVDDTPGMIVVSGFNPVRREVARLSMERLIQDGRIHPSRIEELVAQTKKDVNHKLLQLGKDAAVETNIRGLSNKILSLIGALSYRTSYGQNVLRHSVEVAFLSQVMADELGLDGTIARRAGLLHDRSPGVRDCCTTSARPSTTTSRATTPQSAPIISSASTRRRLSSMPLRDITATCRRTTLIRRWSPPPMPSAPRARAPAEKRSNGISSGWKSSRRLPAASRASRTPTPSRRGGKFA